MPKPQFEVVEDEAAPSKTDIDEALLRLRILGQRAVIALSDLFSLITVATVFVLALLIVPHEPNVYQLTGLGGYCIFVVAVNLIVRKKR